MCGAIVSPWPRSGNQNEHSWHHIRVHPRPCPHAPLHATLALSEIHLGSREREDVAGTSGGPTGAQFAYQLPAAMVLTTKMGSTMWRARRRHRHPVCTQTLSASDYNQSRQELEHHLGARDPQVCFNDCLLTAELVTTTKPKNCLRKEVDEADGCCYTRPNLCQAQMETTLLKQRLWTVATYRFNHRRTFSVAKLNCIEVWFFFLFCLRAREKEREDRVTSDSKIPATSGNQLRLQTWSNHNDLSIQPFLTLTNMDETVFKFGIIFF